MTIDLDAIEARALAFPAEMRVSSPDGAGEVYLIGLDQGWDHEMAQAHAEFIAAARADVLALVARARELEAEEYP